MCQREWRKGASKSQKASKDAPSRAKKLLKEVKTVFVVLCIRIGQWYDSTDYRNSWSTIVIMILLFTIVIYSSR